MLPASESTLAASATTVIAAPILSPLFFANGLTPKKQGADSAPLRCLIYDRVKNKPGFRLGNKLVSTV